jgi:hypothetical protein
MVVLITKRNINKVRSGCQIRAGGLLGCLMNKGDGYLASPSKLEICRSVHSEYFAYKEVENRKMDGR